MARDKITTRILLPVISILVFLILAEIVLRILPVGTDFQNRFFLVNRALDYPEVFKKDAELFWRLKPNAKITSKFFENKAYSINNYGLRNGPIEVEKENFRIIGLGNSCTFGWGIADSVTYLAQLSRMIESSGLFPPVEVINAGIPGYSSLQGKRFLESDLLKFKPDILLIMFAWNDQWAAAGNIPDKDQEFPPKIIITLQNSLSNLKLYRLMKRLILSSIEEPLEKKLSKQDIVYRVGLDDYYNNYVAMVKLCRENGIRPIILTSPIPNLETYYGTGKVSPMHRYHYYYNNRARQVAADYDVDLVDLAAIFDNYNDLFDDVQLDPIHFNAKGNWVAAEAIYEHLLNNQFIK